MPIHPDTQLRLVQTTEDAAALLRWLGERRDGPLAFDTETTGLDPLVDRVRLIQFGDKMTGWAIPFEGPRSWGGLAAEVFERWDGDWVAHNTTYDHAMLEVAAGFDLSKIKHRMHDTRLMAAVLEPEYSNALKSQAARHVDKKAAGASRQLDTVMSTHKWSWGTVPITGDRAHPAYIYHVYGALDCVLTAHLFDVLHPRVQAEAPKAYDLELAYSWLCRQMEIRGVRCDREFTQSKHDQFTKYVDGSAAYVLDRWGCSPWETAKIIAVMQADGIEFGKHTAGGALSLDRSVLEPLAAAHPLAEMVLKRRRTEKVASSFLQPFLRLSERDGYLHPNINSVGGRNKSTGESGGDYGVRTGRSSMSDPNLQALPRIGDGNPVADVVRDCIVADEGTMFVKSDLDQIEVRLLAAYTNSEQMQAALHEADVGGGDFFTNIARQMYHDPTITKKHPIRSRVKSSIYATSYGSGIPKFAMTAGLSITEAQEVVSRLHSTFPDLKRFMKVLETQCKTQGYVESPITGRRHRPDEGFAYKALNYYVQGTAAEIFKMQGLELDAAGVGEYLRLPCHDEWTVQCPESEVQEVARIIHSVMNNSTLLPVPITAGVMVGQRWGEKTEYAI